MSKLKQYQNTYLAARDDALKTMDRANNNFAEHGLNQNGNPMREAANHTNEAVREVEQVDDSPDKPKWGAGAVKSMGLKGWDEIGHATRAFHDADTVPVAPSYLEAGVHGPTQSPQVQSPLQELQQELNAPEAQQEQEMER